MGGGRCGSIYCPGPQLCVALALAGISTCSWLSCMAPRGGPHQESSSPGSITPLTPTPLLLQAFANFCQLLSSIASFCNSSTLSVVLSQSFPLETLWMHHCLFPARALTGTERECRALQEVEPGSQLASTALCFPRIPCSARELLLSLQSPTSSFTSSRKPSLSPS